MFRFLKQSVIRVGVQGKERAKNLIFNVKRPKSQSLKMVFTTHIMTICGKRFKSQNQKEVFPIPIMTGCLIGWKGKRINVGLNPELPQKTIYI